jgi:DNA mismatch repair protein MutL
VIERPASVVKELVENSLDAGASRITVEISGGGLETIRVSDDGCGIDSDELETAFQRHATSKLDDSTDLSRILTLGFRGEALPSIAAAAEVEVVSRPVWADSGAFLRLVPEAPAEKGQRGAPVGTSVTVRRLFERMPARRRFLRPAASEASAVAAVVSHYALAYPEVKFALRVDGRDALQTPGSGVLRDAASAVYGADVAAAMLEVRLESGGLVLRGLAAPPQISRSSRSYISIFVNRRWIQNRRLTFAAEAAYEGMLMAGRHPVLVLDVRVPYEEVDVNVHPAKAEVRFRDEAAVFKAVQTSLRRTLLDAAPVPGPATGGAALRGQPTAPPLWEHALRLAGAGRPPSVAAATGPATATAGTAATTPRQVLPALRVIGQLGSTYIVAEGPEGMYLIDQHAAHERVLYERFWNRRQSGRPETQGLLQPLTVELTARQRATIAEHEQALREHGFDIEPFGGGTYIVRAVPSALAAGDLRESLSTFLDTMLDEGEGDRRDPVAMSLACHAAVRAGKTLAPEEMRELVRELEQTESPHTCPHGRPTMIHMSVELLAREFGRR